MARTKPEIKKVPPKEEPIAAWNMHPKTVKAPRRWVKVLMTVVQWLVVATVLFFVLFGFHFKLQLPVTKPMPGYLVILFGLSAAYVWVDVLRWGVSRPFNCLTCLSGWFCLILAFAFHTHYWYLYLPLGAFVGGLYSKIVMRWL